MTVMIIRVAPTGIDPVTFRFSVGFRGVVGGWSKAVSAELPARNRHRIAGA